VDFRIATPVRSDCISGTVRSNALPSGHKLNRAPRKGDEVGVDIGNERLVAERSYLPGISAIVPGLEW
jgi:hypothetical protein